MKEKSLPKTGDRYYFVDLNLNVGHDTVTDDIHSVAYKVQTARHLAGNFFQTFEEAKEMADKVVELFNL
jgi:hypothetical protein